MSVSTRLRGGRTADCRHTSSSGRTVHHSLSARPSIRASASSRASGQPATAAEVVAGAGPPPPANALSTATISTTSGSKEHAAIIPHMPLDGALLALVVAAAVLCASAQPAEAQQQAIGTATDISGLIQGWLDAVKQLAEELGPVYGAALFCGVYILFTIFLVPGSILTLAAGAIFGPVEGTAVVSVASTMGACAAFLIARYLARPSVERRLDSQPRLKSVISSISAEGGAKLVLLLRLSPLLPFTLLNYTLGLTSISFRDYSLASWAGMLPATFAYVYLGGAGRAAGSGEVSTQQLVIWGVGAAATLLATKLVSDAASKALKEAEERQRLLQQGGGGEGGAVEPRDSR